MLSTSNACVQYKFRAGLKLEESHLYFRQYWGVYLPPAKQELAVSPLVPVEVVDQLIFLS